MFVDEARFGFREALAAEWTSLRDEAAALPEAEWFEWSAYAAISGAWHLAPLFASIEGVPLEHIAQSLPRVSALCPRTMEALGRIPGLTGAAFSRLGPGAHIHSHADHPGFIGTVRGHLGLDVPSGCLLRCVGQARAWVEGQWMFFLGDTEHEAVNDSGRQRTVLLIDVEAARYPELVGDE